MQMQVVLGDLDLGGAVASRDRERTGDQRVVGFLVRLLNRCQDVAIGVMNDVESHGPTNAAAIRIKPPPPTGGLWFGKIVTANVVI